jgi:hypothetical protein
MRAQIARSRVLVSQHGRLRDLGPADKSTTAMDNQSPNTLATTPRSQMTQE